MFIFKSQNLGAPGLSLKQFWKGINIEERSVRNCVNPKMLSIFFRGRKIKFITPTPNYLKFSHNFGYYDPIFLREYNFLTIDPRHKRFGVQSIRYL